MPVAPLEPRTAPVSGLIILQSAGRKGAGRERRKELRHGGVWPEQGAGPGKAWGLWNGGAPHLSKLDSAADRFDPAATSRGRVLRDTTLTVALILTSRLLGFVRERAVAEVFGRNAQTDAFKAAFNIPDLMYFLLVGGAITAAFIPVFTGYLARGQEDEGWRVASTFINGTVALLVTATIAGIVWAPALAPLVAHGFEGAQRALLVDLMRWIFPAVFFTALAGLGMGVLNSYRCFAVPLLGPVLYNVGIILGAYGLGPWIGIHGMAVGTVAGATTNAAVQWALVLGRYRRWRPVLEWRHPGVRRLYGLMLPALFGLSITQLSLIISTNLASSLPAGSITALTLANAVMQFPLGVFAMGLSMVAFPTMAARAARGEGPDFLRTVHSTMQATLYLTVPSAVGLAVLADPIVRLLFQAGQFTTHDSRATAVALVFYSGGLVSQSAIQILTRAFYSLQDTRTPVIVSAGALVVNTVLSLAFLRFTAMAHAGLALSFTLTSLGNWGIYLVLLGRRTGGMAWSQLGGFLARVVGTCIPMAWAVAEAAGWAAGRAGLESLRGRAIVVATGIVTGVGVYALAGWALGLGEARQATEVLRRGLARARQATQAWARRLGKLREQAAR
ncbi:murein biosynthesis integral membrane protein MurJ [Carboxydochorda subterranea]|uniref:Probable lipid II flippase MurJ n=1 Tax=Carboxydichorda subterranea TaxID=3109565 RepID=A0ABZ1C1G0_9FIRM|nr:murein biosynthesis integral membrane protein MurJ [Limnochorda sp. L945t]WRP18941.1 murein biosynthesis integral membrane protein MurJ [Limnochorda sp. L945t]